MYNDLQIINCNWMLDRQFGVVQQFASAKLHTKGSRIVQSTTRRAWSKSWRFLRSFWNLLFHNNDHNYHDYNHHNYNDLIWRNDDWSREFNSWWSFDFNYD